MQTSLLQNELYSLYFDWPMLLMPAAAFILSLLAIFFFPSRRGRIVMGVLFCLAIPTYWHFHVRNAHISSAVLAMAFPSQHGVLVAEKVMALDYPIFTFSTPDGSNKLFVAPTKVRDIFKLAGRRDLLERHAQTIRKRSGLDAADGYHFIRPGVQGTLK